MRSHDEVKAELFAKDPELQTAYEVLGPEYEFRRAIIVARLAAGLTQAELAARMGTTQSAVARMESGTFDPRVGTLRKLALALGVQIQILPDALKVVPIAGKRRQVRTGGIRLSKSA